MTGTRIYRNGVGFQNQAFAQKAVANQQQPTQFSLNQTVEFYSAHDVVESDTLPGLFYVRSKFSPHRYFTVYGNECSCGKVNCSHAYKAFLVRQEEVA